MLRTLSFGLEQNNDLQIRFLKNFQQNSYFIAILHMITYILSYYGLNF